MKFARHPKEPLPKRSSHDRIENVFQHRFPSYRPADPLRVYLLATSPHAHSIFEALSEPIWIVV